MVHANVENGFARMLGVVADQGRALSLSAGFLSHFVPITTPRRPHWDQWQNSLKTTAKPPLASVSRFLNMHFSQGALLLSKSSCKENDRKKSTFDYLRKWRVSKGRKDSCFQYVKGLEIQNTGDRGQGWPHRQAEGPRLACDILCTAWSTHSTSCDRRIPKTMYFKRIHCPFRPHTKVTRPLISD